MTRIVKILVLLALVVSTLLVLTPAPASAAPCPVDQSICDALIKTFRPVLCQTKIISCDTIFRLLFTPEPEPNANCNDALRYADTPPTTERGLRWAEFAIICLVNQERTSRQLPPLRIDDRLVRAARDHATCIVANNPSNPHESAACGTEAARARAAGYNYRSFASNAFALRGSDGTLISAECTGPNGRIDTAPRDAVIGWMCSPGHRRNILGSNFVDTGVGAVFGSYRAGESDTATTREQYPPVSYVQLFAQPL